MANQFARFSSGEHPSMSDFTIDADPFIPSGVAATVEEVAAFVVDGILPAAKVADLAARQQPDDVKAAVLDAIAVKVEAGADAADFTAVLSDIGAKKSEIARAEPVLVESAVAKPVDLIAESLDA